MVRRPGGGSGSILEGRIEVTTKPTITTIFFDLGGVLLSKGWDHEFRRQASAHFALDANFEARHEKVAKIFECGQLDLEDYLDQVVFNQPRAFAREQFVTFIHQQQTPIAGSLALLPKLSKLFLATLNNESRELNAYRIERFELRRYFNAFFSSCFLGFMKPEPPIYRLALDVAQRRAGECLFIDDTFANLEAAAVLGMDTIHFISPEQLQAALQQRGLIA